VARIGRRSIMGRMMIRCSNCGGRFEQVSSWKDVFRPHMLNRRMFQCPHCNVSAFDQVEETLL
jgi:DNA-directed RNA polymerase subunit RPC12/RpoP